MTKSVPEEYKNLVALSTKIHTYQSILNLLHWDQETYMPAGGMIPRSQQIGELSHLIHEEKKGSKFKHCLSQLVHLNSGKPRIKGLSREQLAACREWLNQFDKSTKLSSAFVKNFSQVTAEASQIWAIAKKSNNFKLFAPFLGKIVQLNREKAETLGFEDHPYDALLQGYEPCMSTMRVGKIFDGLEKELKALLKKIKTSRAIDDRFLWHAVDDKKQMSLSQLLLSKLPLDKAYSRLDLSSHPFSIALHPHDSRITTRFLPKAFISNIFSVLHEAGHSLYEMGLPAEHWGTPLAEYVSLSIHESQSRFWETLIGRSLPFWKFFYPYLQKELIHLKKVPLDRFYRAINKVSSSLIRVEADEVTYGLHVILRFRIEKQLIEGTLQVADLPSAWNAEMQNLFEITPPTDTLGCLQDIHWSLGDFGYFPTYALGNLFAAQFFEAFKKEFPDWEKRVAAGNLDFIREWLKQNVYRWGRIYDANQLIKKASSKPLSEKAYCSYLKKKYAEIYTLSPNV
jgi:carboxypeptidase Taq